MRPGNWIACILFATIAGTAAVFLGVDVRHTVAITAAAFMAGAVNILLEALPGSKAVLDPARIAADRGLGDIQSLAFSLSVNKGFAGNRAQLQLRRAARGTLSLYGLTPDDAGPALADIFSPQYDGQDMPRPLFLAAITELEQILHEPPARPARPGRPAHSAHPAHAANPAHASKGQGSS